MPVPLSYPGVYIEEVRTSGSLPGAIPAAHDDPGPTDDIWASDSLSSPVSTAGADSEPLDQAAYEGSQANKTGLFGLEKTDLFNLLCIPPVRSLRRRRRGLLSYRRDTRCVEGARGD